MKDRTPKFPGRVKLDPVAGQTNTYDMTRADDPDDTGTPFNTRTMLQDSTARFLRIPVSNPFVDDALRHMPDRINPIGTIRTSPALSLGDAWLPCDGSQVTFAEYPQLCQLLRGTASTQWDGKSLGISALAGTISRPVYFDGRWIAAYLKPAVSSATNTKIYPVTIISAPTLDGDWTEEYTVNKSFSSQERLHIACSEEKCVVLVPTADDYGNAKVEGLFCNVGSTTWTSVVILSTKRNYINIYGFEENDGAFAFVITDSWNSDLIVYHTTSPDVPSSWTESNKIERIAQWEQTSFSHANGRWILCEVSAYNTGKELLVAESSDASGFAFETRTLVIPNMSDGANAISPTVYMNGRYYMLIDGYVNSSNPKSNNVVLASSTDLKSWEYKVISKNTEEINMRAPCAIAANEKMLVFSNNKHTWASADPEAAVNEETLPTGSVPEHLLFIGNTAYALTLSSIAYHDYSTDTRLLPTISISDDTTTFIKAKNELDVFEAQQSGGD